MPIYEYKCEHCGKVVEVLTTSASGDSAPRKCSCGQDSKFERLYSTFAAHAFTHNESQIAPCGREDCCRGACGQDG